MKLEIWSFQPARSSPVRSVTFPGGVKVKADTLNSHVWILWHRPPGLVAGNLDVHYRKSTQSMLRINIALTLQLT